MTRPAPDRRAPTAARCAAPVLPREPATIRTCPKLPLCASARRSGTSAFMASRVRSSTRGPSRASMTSLGMPMSATMRLPTCRRAGGSTRGSFGAPSVTVSDASTHGPISSLVSEDIPLGRSIATTGRPIALTSSTTVWKNPDSGVLRPVPNRASTTTSHPAISEECSSHCSSRATSTTGSPSRARISRLTLASPFTSPRGASTNTLTSTPRWRSTRATTNPSPPLLPRPASTATRRSPRSSRAPDMAATTCRPAFSISTADGTPISSIVRRSASRICSAVRIRIGALGGVKVTGGGSRGVPPGSGRRRPPPSR